MPFHRHRSHIRCHKPHTPMHIPENPHGLWEFLKIFTGHNIIIGKQGLKCFVSFPVCAKLRNIQETQPSERYLLGDKPLTGISHHPKHFLISYLASKIRRRKLSRWTSRLHVCVGSLQCCWGMSIEINHSTPPS